MNANGVPHVRGDEPAARRLKIGIKIGRVIVKGENCMSDYEIMDGSPTGSNACKHKETGAATIVSTAENIFARTLENAPANDDLLHGRARLCRSCGCETQSIDVCPACADAMREERATEQAERCRIHRVRRVEDLPVHVLEEMQRGRC